MGKKQKLLLSVAGSLVLTLFLYILLHEGGHTLVALFCGADIMNFSFFPVHVSWMGGEFNTFTISLADAAGVGLPILVSVVYMLFYSKENQNIFYRTFSVIFSIVPFYSLIAWMILPVMYVNGRILSDDVIHFIEHSGINPWIVCVTAAALFAGGVVLVWKRGILRNYIEICKK